MKTAPVAVNVDWICKTENKRKTQVEGSTLRKSLVNSVGIFRTELHGRTPGSMINQEMMNEIHQNNAVQKCTFLAVDTVNLARNFRKNCRERSSFVAFE